MLGVWVGVHLSVRVWLVRGLLLVGAVREVEGGGMGRGLVVFEVEGAGVRGGVRLGERGLVLERSAVLAIRSLGLMRLVRLVWLSVGGLVELVWLSIGSLVGLVGLAI